MKRRQQNRSAEAVWRERLARFDKCNLTVAEFCRREGVSDPSFYQWRRRLQSANGKAKQRPTSGSSGASQSGSFAPVLVTGSAMAEVEFPNGLRVRVPAAHTEALHTAIVAGKDLLKEVSRC
jgi:transposase-like protein